MLVPEFSNLQDKYQKYHFAYSIRMSLSPEGCTINGMNFSSCQLHSRHWIIRMNDTVVDRVDGEAVIGQVSFDNFMFFCFFVFFSPILNASLSLLE